MTHATVSSETTTENVLGITIVGEIDLSNAVEVEDRILDLTTNQLTAIVIDLTDLTYIDSAGLKVLFTLATRLEISQIDLELVVPPDSPVRSAIEITGMASVASIRPAVAGDH
ncbi:MAG: STAS domain-containing protein [Pseudonocardia sp.]|jgi:anti-anti-sigma factor